jgi:hypothetical protein
MRAAGAEIARDRVAKNVAQRVAARHDVPSGSAIRSRREPIRAMPHALFVALLASAALLLHAGSVHAAKTVCTITVNSSDEKEAFRRHLPHEKYQFVELVEYGRPDWLASACRRGVRCDVLIVSGHFNGEAFFPDTLAFNEHLPIDELERVSCSDSCPGLFSQLKEVYLFGCDTLSPQAGLSDAGDVVRSLVRAGHAKPDAERLARSLRERHGESNRAVMRRLFMDVPLIYGFASFAPLGPVAGPKLGRYFQSSSTRDVANGRPSQGLLSHFAANALTFTSGLRASDPQAAFRADVCRFVDERITLAQKLRFVHAVMTRSMAETRMFFVRIERLLASIDDEARGVPAVAEALAEIRGDARARDAFLAFARDSDRPAIRVRMTAVARSIGWLTPDEERGEIIDLIGKLMSDGPMTAAEVALLCSLNRDGSFSGELARWSSVDGGVGRAAGLACLGSAEQRTHVLEALRSPHEHESRLAEAYLHHRPITDGTELTRILADVAESPARDAHARTLGTLAKQRVSDVASMIELVRLFANAQSLALQRAIAGILIRSDFTPIANPDTARTLQHARVRSADGEDIIDILIRRIDPSLTVSGSAQVSHVLRTGASRGGP